MVPKEECRCVNDVVSVRGLKGQLRGAEGGGAWMGVWGVCGGGGVCGCERQTEAKR